MNNRPTLQDVYETRKRIAPYVVRTPLHRHRALESILGAEVYVKHENHQVLGAFKVRGAVNVVSRLSDEDKSRGVISSSTGNFGQGIAYAAGIFGVEVHVVVPTDVNPGKAESMRLLGADLILHGDEFDEARQHAERLALEQGYRYIHSANEPMLTAGTGTYTLEIMEDLPDVDVIIGGYGPTTPVVYNQNRHFAGVIDEVYFYDDALTEAEIGALMDAPALAVSARGRLPVVWSDLKTGR